MLNFLRKHAATIGLGIVIFFAGTMFSGAFFLKQSNKSQSQQLANLQEAIALIGTAPVDQQLFLESLRQNAIALEESDTAITPEMSELLAYSSFTQALQQSVLAEGAKEAKVKLKKQDIQASLEAVYRAYDIKGLKELKELLKDKNYPYDLYMDNLKRDATIRKFVGELQQGIAVTDQDIENAYTKVNVSHIIVLSSDNENAKQEIQTIENEIKNGMPFETAAKNYSEDTYTKDKGGKIGWLKVGDTHESFEDVAFSVEKGQMSGIIETPAGYHLIKVNDRVTEELPVGDALEQARAELLKQAKSRAIQQFIDDYLVDHPLEIKDLSLKAYHAKLEGDIEGAIGAYHGLISRQPGNPVPQYLLGNLYSLTGNKKQAKEYYLKATILAESDAGRSFPAYFVELGKLQKEDKEFKAAQESFNAAINVAKGNLKELKLLDSTFRDLKETKALETVKAEIKAIVQNKNAEQSK